jgi:hypothetical protein
LINCAITIRYIDIPYPTIEAVELFCKNTLNKKAQEIYAKPHPLITSAKTAGDVIVNTGISKIYLPDIQKIREIMQ